MLAGFKKFMLRGNVIDLAVAVIIGAAFGAVVTSLVTNIFTPLLAAIFGKPDFSALVANVNGSEVKYGLFLNSVLSFLLVSVAIYFFMIVPMNYYTERRRRGEPPADTTTKKCPECVSEIAIAARRCPQCTTVLQPGTAVAAH